ncbi:MAG TPA: polysaccharide biosynthesis/export family protein, partial [Deltaproteobacteria bacterium]|nr:polysaccharide biosynthesis/export family protein [Deltaproteobacteria bacterium]
MLFSLFLLFLAGCAHKPVRPQNISPPALPPVVTDEYVLQPYDSLEIKFFYNPELNDTVTIRPEGKISLQMIDEVRAAGLTPAQLDDLLTQKYGLLLNRVMITVIVRTFTDQKVYVGGEVFLPQVV